MTVMDILNDRMKKYTNKNNQCDSAKRKFDYKFSALQDIKEAIKQNNIILVGQDPKVEKKVSLGRYTWDTDKGNEVWNHDTFDKEEDCISDAKKNYCIGVGETIYIGTISNFKVSIDAEDVLERLSETACDFGGESAEDWCWNNCDSNEKLEIDELSLQLTEVVSSWLKKYHMEPSFYRIDDIKSFEVV